MNRSSSVSLVVAFVVVVVIVVVIATFFPPILVVYECFYSIFLFFSLFSFKIK